MVYDALVGYCEHGNGPPGIVKGGKCFQMLNYCYLLSEDCCMKLQLTTLHTHLQRLVQRDIHLLDHVGADVGSKSEGF